MKFTLVTYRKLVSISLMLLLTYGCALTDSAMIKAARTGDVNTLKSLRVEGQNINECDSAGTTALMHVIHKKNIEAAKYLIESGADLKAKDKYGYDALTYAVENRQIEIMKLLIDKGADVDSRDIQGNIPLYPPLYHAIEGRFTEGVKLLVKNGANINAKTIGDNAETIIDYALFHKQMDVAASLGDKLWVPDPGKARIFFIGEGLYDYTSVRIGNRRKDLSLASGFTFIDVDPGNHAIVVCEMHTEKAKPTLSIDTVAGQIYYFSISQEMKRRMAHYIGYRTDSFIVTPLKESEAKELIKLLLHN
jgi:ankyrin repeat protein